MAFKNRICVSVILDVASDYKGVMLAFGKFPLPKGARGI